MDTRHPFDHLPDKCALRVEFNEGQTAFVVGSETSYRVHDTATGKLILDRGMHVLSSTRYLGLISGGHRRPSSPDRFVFWDHDRGTEVFEIEYNRTPVRASLTGSHYCVVFERGAILYTLSLLSRQNQSDTRTALYQTVVNKHGLCCLGNKKLVLPARSKGQVQIIDIASQQVSILPAHETALQMFSLTRDETMLATASEKGTLIKLWSTSREASIMQFRRGLEHASIFSIAFSPTGERMAVTSDKSTIHIFDMPWRTEHSNDGQFSSTTSRPEQISVLRPSNRFSSPPGRSLSTEAFDMMHFAQERHGINLPHVAKNSLGTSPSEDAFANPSDAHPAQLSPDALSRPYQRPQSRRSPFTSVGVSESFGDYNVITKGSSQKYGNLGGLPLAPRFLKDNYSIMSCRFEMGDDARPQTEFVQGKERARDTEKKGTTTARVTPAADIREHRPWCLDDQRPSKGKIAWLDEHSLVVVGAGRDARWEKFVLGVDAHGQRGIERRGWKRYMDDEGVDI